MIINKILIFFLRLYKKFISPALRTSCPYTPTCSIYAIEALKKHNVFISIPLIIWRLLRCNWFTKGGFDPVPDKHSLKKWLL